MRILGANFSKQIRYVVVGVWNTLFAYSSFVVLYYATAPLKIHYLVLLTVNQVISYTNAYIASKVFVFKTKGNVLREYCRFCMFYASFFLINLLIFPVLVEFLHFNPLVAQGLILVGTIVIGFIWHDKYSFKIDKVASEETGENQSIARAISK